MTASAAMVSKLRGPSRPEPFLRAHQASKTYGSTAALRNVSLDFFPGEVHALVGENGAGKSTLMRLLAGEEAPTGGTISVNGRAGVASPSEARAAGIAMIHQQFQLVDSLTVAENIFLGCPPLRMRLGPLSILDGRAMREAAKKRLQPFGLAHRVDDRVGDLSVAEKQLVEIGRSLDDAVRMLILDEPTASLGDEEIETLFGHIRRIRSRGAAVVLIAHNIDEVLAIADRISVLRGGALVGSRSRGEIDGGEIVRMIVGRSIEQRFPKTDAARGGVLLETSGMLGGREENDIRLHRGELLGMPSFVGSMVDEFLEKVSGARAHEGAVALAGRPIGNRSIAGRVRAGLAIVPGNTLLEGLIPTYSIEDNILLPNLARFSRGFVVDRRRLRQATKALIAELDIRPANPKAVVGTLSGGNRQKVVLAKWLASGATVFVMNDPTKAVDVGAKVEIYRLMGRIVEKGGAVLFSSSDTDELVGIADRVVVLRGEDVVARFDGHPVSKQQLLHTIVGASGAAPAAGIPAH